MLKLCWRKPKRGAAEGLLKKQRINMKNKLALVLVVMMVALMGLVQTEFAAEISSCVPRNGHWELRTESNASLLSWRMEDLTVFHYTPRSWSMRVRVNYWDGTGVFRGYTEEIGVYYLIKYFTSTAWMCTNAVRIVDLDGDPVTTNALPNRWAAGAPLRGDVGRLSWPEGEYIRKVFQSTTSYLVTSYNYGAHAEMWYFWYQFPDGTLADIQRPMARPGSPTVYIPGTEGKPFVWFLYKYGPYEVPQPPERILSGGKDTGSTTFD